MHKTIQYFDKFFVYETTVVEVDKNYEIKREKIQILEEKINEGATVPTYIAKYPNGDKASISTNMYFKSQEEADRNLYKELQESYSSTMKFIGDLNDKCIKIRKVMIDHPELKGEHDE